MKKRIASIILALTMIFGACHVSLAAGKSPKYSSTARQTERLDRGLIAVRTYSAPNNGITAGVYLSWRLLGDESLENQAFDIYRNGVKIYTTSSHGATNYTDQSGTENDEYTVVKKGCSISGEKAVKAFTEHNKTARGSYAANGTSEKNSFTYMDVPIVRPANVKNYGGGTSTYYAGANDASVGDLDGDGEYEIVLKWDPSDSKDSASSGYTGNVYIDGYKISEDNGGYMWRIDLGKNIRAGAHYTQFMVYDLDGDGRSEVAMKTAPGSIDGTGKYVTEVGDSEEIRSADNSAVYLSGKGIPNAGGEYLTIFDGETGEALYTTDYISRGTVSEWGDSKYNRSERYLAAVAYINGVTPSLIMCRGYYAKAVVRAYNWDGEKLELVWEHVGSTSTSSSLYGQGNHNLSVADVDNDGRDEIVYGSAVLDDNGKVIGNTKLGHGDAMHVSDFNNDGVQEVFSVKEKNYKTNAVDFRVASTGQNIFALPGNDDNGRGVMANVDDSYAAEHPEALSMGWSVADDKIHDLTGAEVNAKPSANSRTMTNFLVYWDGDLGRELLDDTIIAKYHADTGYTIRFYNDGSGYSLPASSNNGSKMTPSLVADIWGDWREEIIMPYGTGEDDMPYLRIFTSTIPTSYRLTTLMHDSQYRLAVAWQNVAYNQPPHQSYYIGTASLAEDEYGNKLNYLAPEVSYTTVKYAENTSNGNVKLSGAFDDSASFSIGGKFENSFVSATLYNSDGTLCETKIFECEGKRNESGTVSFDNGTEGKRLKLFLWDKSSIKPLAEKCDSEGVLKKLSVYSATASSEPEAQNIAKNSYDGDFSSVWASEGEQNIIYDLGDDYNITGVKIAFKKYDDDRTIPFSVSVSEDGKIWESVYSGTSVPLSGEFINVGVSKNARYVKLDVKGNSVSGWTSLSEVEFYGI
jgi:rhamnogalacturonan endolyase